MSRTVCLFCLLFFFVQGTWGVEKLSVTLLPKYADTKNLSESNHTKAVDDEKNRSPQEKFLTWNLRKTRGVQWFDLYQTYITPAESPLPKQPPVYQYKGMMINVDMGKMFSIGSILTLGYEEDKLPLDFSFFSLPKQEHLWNTLQYSILINKNFTLWDTLSIAPFGGFLLSQYNLNILGADYPLFYRRYQSTLIGIGIVYTPHRFWQIDCSLSFSPYNLIYDMNNSLSQFSYKISGTFKTSFFSLTGIVSSESNFEHKFIDERRNILVVSSIGFYFTITI